MHGQMDKFALTLSFSLSNIVNSLMGGHSYYARIYFDFATLRLQKNVFNKFINLLELWSLLLVTIINLFRTLKFQWLIAR